LEEKTPKIKNVGRKNAENKERWKKKRRKYRTLEGKTAKVKNVGKKISEVLLMHLQFILSLIMLRR